MPSSALPLKVPSTPAKNGENDKDKTPMAASKQTPAAKSGTLVPGDISSPHELTAFVETLLEQLDTKFDDMSKQILDRMSQMSSRVDALEASIQDIINGDIGSNVSASIPQSPSPAPSASGTGLRRSDSGAL
ncbi:Heat shock factor-binding protein 1 [Leucoagaricus sp. SymC.cos]|nr:Heat shock factor-binding protein 1 [Leucoagaricus sp. SymC.cos]